MKRESKRAIVMTLGVGGYAMRQVGVQLRRSERYRIDGCRGRVRLSVEGEEEERTGRRLAKRSWMK